MLTVTSQTTCRLQHKPNTSSATKLSLMCIFFTSFYANRHLRVLNEIQKMLTHTFKQDH